MASNAEHVLREIDSLWSLIQEARVSYSGDHASGTFRICGDRLSKIRDAVAALAPAAAPEAGEWVRVPRAMLEAAVCPMAANGCDGEQYPVGDPRGDYYGEQCQFCYERKQALAAPAQSQAVTEGGYQRAWEHLTANSYDHHTPHMVCIPRDEWKAAEALIATPTAAGEAAAPAPQEGGREYFDAWHDAKYPEPDLYHHKVEWRASKRAKREAWDAALAAHQQRGMEDEQ